ncbi:GAF domain-containing protein [Pleionea sediminis]|uniref:GAF domain-containing protein n=1 Tax=Pleionea sediminis TaxID=2569479 RepID=UPI001186843D|nr:GAF domain-containing protein [Pleionea sediminis]
MHQLESDFSLYYDNKSSYYQSLCQQLEGLLSIERDPITNMSQVASFVFYSIPDLNWSGFYLNVDDENLRLGPFNGKVACVHIPFGKGVCGTVAQQRQSVRVDDVHSFAGHIACDSASNSEIVVPIVHDGRLFGVLDIDSPTLNRFDDDDLVGFEKLAATFAAATNL